MKRIRTITGVMLSAAVLAACSSDDLTTGQPETGGERHSIPVSLTAEIGGAHSRVSLTPTDDDGDEVIDRYKAAWEEGDKIIVAYGGETSELSIENITTTEGGNSLAIFSGELSFTGEAPADDATLQCYVKNDTYFSVNADGGFTMKPVQDGTIGKALASTVYHGETTLGHAVVSFAPATAILDLTLTAPDKARSNEEATISYKMDGETLISHTASFSNAERPGYIGTLEIIYSVPVPADDADVQLSYCQTGSTKLYERQLASSSKPSTMESGYLYKQSITFEPLKYDYLYNDGTWGNVPYRYSVGGLLHDLDWTVPLTSYANGMEKFICAIVFYAASDTQKTSDADSAEGYTHGYAMTPMYRPLPEASRTNMNHGAMPWATSNSDSPVLSSTISSPNYAASYLDGRSDTEVLVDLCSSSNIAYPAAWYANHCDEVRPEGASEWFLPSAGQVASMFGIFGNTYEDALYNDSHDAVDSFYETLRALFYPSVFTYFNQFATNVTATKTLDGSDLTWIQRTGPKTPVIWTSTEMNKADSESGLYNRAYAVSFGNMTGNIDATLNQNIVLLPISKTAQGAFTDESTTDWTDGWGFVWPAIAF